MYFVSEVLRNLCVLSGFSGTLCAPGSNPCSKAVFQRKDSVCSVCCGPDLCEQSCRPHALSRSKGGGCGLEQGLTQTPSSQAPGREFSAEPSSGPSGFRLPCCSPRLPVAQKSCVKASWGLCESPLPSATASLLNVGFCCSSLLARANPEAGQLRVPLLSLPCPTFPHSWQSATE